MAKKNIMVTYQEVTDEDLKKLTPSKVTFNPINGEIGFPNPDDGGKTTIKGRFKICDGIATGICEVEGEVREVYAQYPLSSLINNTPAAKSMKESILDVFDVKEDRDVTILEIFTSYARFKFVDGN